MTFYGLQKRSLELFLKEVVSQDGRHASYLSIIIITQQVPLGLTLFFCVSSTIQLLFPTMKEGQKTDYPIIIIIHNKTIHFIVNNAFIIITILLDGC